MPGGNAAKAGKRTSLIDTHAHFVDPTRPEGVVWPDKDAPFYGRKRVEEYAREMTNPDLAGVIAVETSRRECDDDYLLKISQRSDLIAGYVANLAPGDASFERRLAKYSLERKFKGIRLRPIGRYDLASDEVASICKLVARYGKIVELGVGSHERLPQFFELARRVPEVWFVLVHAGHPMMDNGRRGPGWKTALLRSAPPDNVWCKITTNFSVHIPSTRSEETRAAIASCIDGIMEAFSVNRLLWGSNWPVSNPQQTNDMMEIIDAHMDRGAAQRVLSENAKDLYALQ